MKNGNKSRQRRSLLETKLEWTETQMDLNESNTFIGLYFFLRFFNAEKIRKV